MPKLGGFNEHIRVVECGSCKKRSKQRMNDNGGFDKIEVCPNPKCKAKGQIYTLRILTSV